MVKVISFILLLFFLAQPIANAAELFGVRLITATKDTLRTAAKIAGARLKREAGKFEFWDEYFSADILKGSDKLFFGFSKQNEKFVFAEYEFKGLRQDRMLRKLTSKYGAPKKIKQVFISDTIYQWNVDGIEINYYRDWRNYKTRVTYVVPQLLADLQFAQKEVNAAIVRGELNKQTNVY